MKNEYSPGEVLQANIQLHTQLSHVYNKTEPHFRKENVARVEKILKDLKRETSGSSLLDVGCGTGFILEIAKCLFQKIRGIDVTPAMLEKINLKTPQGVDMKVSIAAVENMPFENGSFDICTAYAVLHHLHGLEAAAGEIFRVLKDGGIFYSDLDPNYYFWEAIHAAPEDASYSDIVRREVSAVRHKDKELKDKFGIEEDILAKAEAMKHVYGGFREEEIRQIFLKAGFARVDIHYEWFLGEGSYIHAVQGEEKAETIRAYLHDALPAARSLFKYVSIIAKK